MTKLEFPRYILVTPCKNEGNNLPGLIESVAVQTIKPTVWVIVDDGSTDDTPKIIEKAVKVHEWIQSIRLNSQTRDLGLHLAGIMKNGFDYAVSYCRKQGIDYHYLGNLDGDLTLPPTFYANLMREFEKDPRLGVASGGTRHIISGRVVHAVVSANEPSGGHMLIRKECFEECGGIPLTYAVDSVVKAKARLNDWKTKRFEDNIATEIRDVHAAEGYWRGFKHKGETSYYINHNPLHILVRVFMYSFRRPYYAGIAYLVGYIGSFVRRKERIKDIDIRRYYWNKWKEHL
jgi:glycosyltransferase involved in cell wall biosynthesis